MLSRFVDVFSLCRYSTCCCVLMLVKIHSICEGVLGIYLLVVVVVVVVVDIVVVLVVVVVVAMVLCVDVAGRR